MYFSGLWGWEVCQPQGVMLESYSWHLCFVPLRRRSPSRPRRIRSRSLSRVLCDAQFFQLLCLSSPQIMHYAGWRKIRIIFITQLLYNFINSKFLLYSNNFVFALKEHCTQWILASRTTFFNILRLKPLSGQGPVKFSMNYENDLVYLHSFFFVKIHVSNKIEALISQQKLVFIWNVWELAVNPALLFSLKTWVSIDAKKCCCLICI